MGAEVVIRRVNASDADRLRFLATLGLKPGTVLTVRHQQPFNGPITITVEDQEHIIGRELAGALLCAPAEGSTL